VGRRGGLRGVEVGDGGKLLCLMSFLAVLEKERRARDSSVVVGGGGGWGAVAGGGEC
jgi:hypothetical protein